jgi:lipid-A-disaccharide synthase
MKNLSTKNTGRKKVFIIAGESSGDMHASALVKELKKLSPSIEVKAIGGEMIRSEGAELLYHLKEVNYIGFSSVLKNIKKIKTIFNKTFKFILDYDPNILILIDFPGFNLKMASKIRERFKGKIIYYISPQLWAWHEKRVNTIKKCVDKMLVTFPFEIEFYRKHSVESIYAGNPLINRIDDFLSRSTKTGSQKKSVSFMPGSRRDEIDKMLPVMIEAAEEFHTRLDCNIYFICSSNLDLKYYRERIKNENFKIVYDEDAGKSDTNYKTILNSDLVVSKSGTSTMECALIGTPFIVCYKAGKMNYFIAKNLIKLKHIAMINIILGKEAVKEFIQSEMTPANIFKEGEKILNDNAYRGKILNSFNELRGILTNKNASGNAARIILSSI